MSRKTRFVARPRRAGRGYVVAALGALALMTVSPQALAVDITDIGFVDQSAIGALKPFQDAQAQFAQVRAQLNGQFQAAIKGKSQADQQKIYNDFNRRVAQKQQGIFGPLLSRAQIAIASVSANKGLSVVVDRTIVIFGGQDVTKDVIALFNTTGPLVPPVNTPPPGEVGYVDQTQLDALPNVKKANDAFLQARQNLGAQLNAQMNGKSADQKRTLVSQFNQQLAAEQKKDLQPIVDATQKAIADVARKKNLLLVVDATDRVYGGTDVTADVVSALK
jgi:outer membrane protein